MPLQKKHSMYAKSNPYSLIEAFQVALLADSEFLLIRAQVLKNFRTNHFLALIT